MSDNPASWQPDPTGKHDHRYWDGSQWTANVADAGVASTDPYDAPAEAVSLDAPTAITAVPGDDTASYPTAMPPPYPAPPAYSPPPPLRGGGTGGGRRGLVIGGAILAAVVLAVIAFLALDGGDDDDPTSPLGDESAQTTEAPPSSTTEVDPGEDSTDGGTDSDVSDFFAEAYGISQEQAKCLVEELNKAGEEGALDEEEALSHIVDFLAECDISIDDLTGGGEG